MKRPTLYEQQAMKKIISSFEKDQYIELFKIIKKHTNNYTQNTNGIFLNLKDVSTEGLCEMSTYVGYIDQTNRELSKRKK